MFEHRYRTAVTGPLAACGFDRALAECRSALDWLRAAYRDGSLPLLRLTEYTSDLPALNALASLWRQEFDHVLILGAGGASLGGKTLNALADRGFGAPVGCPTLHFLDNVDPDTFDALLRATQGRRIGVVVISKSGSTAETMAQFLGLLPRLGRIPGSKVIAITEPGDTPLRRLAERIAAPVIDHDPLIGGRYSVLSPVGLLPALLAGLNGEAVRQGAGRALRAALGAEQIGDSSAAAGAALNIAAMRCGLTSTVLMPYCDRLGMFGLWFRQLWAESLGKNGLGSTPIRAMGAVDQHSQLQLYLDGPKDKLFTLITVASNGQEEPVRRGLVDDERLDYLAGRSLGELLAAQARATFETLIRHERPARLIALPRLDEERLGALFMHFMLETMLTAHILGVNPFDQPAVEEGKILARRYLSDMAHRVG